MLDTCGSVDAEETTNPSATAGATEAGGDETLSALASGHAEGDFDGTAAWRGCHEKDWAGG